jgi:hypothetical protein
MWAQFLDSPAAAALYPSVGTLITVGPCLTAYAGLQRVGLGWLFSLPFGKQPQPPLLAVADRPLGRVRSEHRDPLGPNR